MLCRDEAVRWVRSKNGSCKVKFTEWTRDDRLRQPVFLGLRADNHVSEVGPERIPSAGGLRRAVAGKVSRDTSPSKVISSLPF